MIYFLITIVSLLIGWYLGVKSAGKASLERIEIEEDGRKTVVRVKDLVKPKSDLKPGLIKRPTPQQVYEKNRPAQEKEANRAMVETLDNIPELREAKKNTEFRRGSDIDAVDKKG